MRRVCFLLVVLSVSTMIMADDVIVPPAAFIEHLATGTSIEFQGMSISPSFLYSTAANKWARAEVNFPPDATGYVYKIFATIFDFSTGGQLEISAAAQQTTRWSFDGLFI